MLYHVLPINNHCKILGYCITSRTYPPITTDLGVLYVFLLSDESYVVHQRNGCHVPRILFNLSSKKQNKTNKRTNDRPTARPTDRPTDQPTNLLLLLLQQFGVDFPSNRPNDNGPSEIIFGDRTANHIGPDGIFLGE